MSLYKAYEFRVEEEKKIFILVVLLTFFSYTASQQSHHDASERARPASQLIQDFVGYRETQKTRCKKIIHVNIIKHLTRLRMAEYSVEILLIMIWL